MNTKNNGMPTKGQTKKQQLHNNIETLLKILENSSSIEPVTKKELSQALKVGEKKIETLIMEARLKGHWIVGLPNVRGYWIATSNRERQEWKAYYTSRTRTQERVLRALKNSGIEGQEVINV